MAQGDLLNSSNHLLSNQTDHPQTFKTAGVLGTSGCIVLDPDLLRFDVHAFPHFSRCAVCFGDPTEVECGDMGQGTQHILPIPLLLFNGVPVQGQAPEPREGSQLVHFSKALDAVAMEIEDTQVEESCQDRINGSQVIEGQVDPGQVLWMLQEL